MPGPYHLRRTDREITDPAHIASILERGRYVTYALVDDGEPYVVTLSYGYGAEARWLYHHVAHVGHKLDVIAREPRACGTVIIDGGYNRGECEHPFESVVLRGRIHVVEDAAEKVRAMHTLVNHLESDPATYWSSRPWKLQDRVQGFTALAFEIESVTAKQGS
jgi:hypothetical protein